MGLTSYPLSPCGRLGRRLKSVRREELHILNVLNLFAEGQRSAEGMEKGMYPWTKMKHQVTGSGQEQAFEDDPLLPVQGWTRQSIQARDAGRGARCPRRAWRPRSSNMGEGDNGVSWVLGLGALVVSVIRWPASTGCILKGRRTQTTVWLHNKLHRHSLPMKNFRRSSTCAVKYCNKK